MDIQPTPMAPFDRNEEISYDDVVVLTAWMAREGSTAEEVAYAVEKPWKHSDLIPLARAAQPFPEA